MASTRPRSKRSERRAATLFLRSISRRNKIVGGGKNTVHLQCDFIFQLKSPKSNIMPHSWFFQDTWTASAHDRDRLLQYLKQHRIEPQGFFADVLDSNFTRSWEPAWRYPAYAVTHFDSTPGLENKLKNLCRKRGSNPNDIERNYSNQLREFQALYTLTTFLGYKFIGWDAPSKKPCADPKKNCDLALSKNEINFFADARDESSEILSQRQDPNGRTHSVPKWNFTKWLQEQFRELEKKGADILVCHPRVGGGPTRFGAAEGSVELNEASIKNYCDEILPSTLTWNSDGPSWYVRDIHVKELIMADRAGCWKISLHSN